MKKEIQYVTVFRTLLAIGFCLFMSIPLSAQKKPTEFESRLDDQQLCKTPITRGIQFSGTEYCQFWRRYSYNRLSTTEGGRELAKDGRNELIKYAQGRIDRFYEENTNDKKRKRLLLQTVLDILEVASSTAIGIINGERAQDLIGVSLTGLQAGRTSLNKNLELQQTRIIVNKMRENRARILANIVSNMRKPVSEYSWLDGKNDLRQYLYAGTFSNAMDSLATATGADAQKAEEKLQIVSGDLALLRETTKEGLAQTVLADEVLESLASALSSSDDTTKSAGISKLKRIVNEAVKNNEFATYFKSRESLNGQQIIEQIDRARRELTLDEKERLVDELERLIIEFGQD